MVGLLNNTCILSVLEAEDEYGIKSYEQKKVKCYKATTWVSVRTAKGEEVKKRGMYLIVEEGLKDTCLVDGHRISVEHQYDVDGVYIVSEVVVNE